MKRIGYQGNVNSNSHRAAKEYIKGVSEDQLIPLTTSRSVVNAIINREVDLGIVAVTNTLGGVVFETRNTLEDLGHEVEEVDRFNLDIVNTFFTKDMFVKKRDINMVVSHPQPLSQCRDAIKHTFGKAECSVCDDTALAAEWLASGELNQDYSGVICPREAGEALGLYPLVDNLTEGKDNKTTFIVLKRKK